VGAALREDDALTRIPPWTTGVLVAAVLVYSLDGAAEALIYDRRAIAAGELWRVLTGHWVHFSPTHLIYDALALAVVGSVLEWRRDPLYPVLLLVAPAAIGVALFALEPNLGRYGGLSGVVFAAAVYLALRGLSRGSRWGAVGGAFLLGLLAKVALEIATGATVLAEDTPVPVPLAHIAGACAGAGLAWSRKLLAGEDTPCVVTRPKTSLGSSS
jgi:rhomboid family GlyGly-CTERM serine protease